MLCVRVNHVKAAIFNLKLDFVLPFKEVSLGDQAVLVVKIFAGLK